MNFMNDNFVPIWYSLLVVLLLLFLMSCCVVSFAFRDHHHAHFAQTTCVDHNLLNSRTHAISSNRSNERLLSLQWTLHQANEYQATDVKGICLQAVSPEPKPIGQNISKGYQKTSSSQWRTLWEGTKLRFRVHPWTWPFQSHQKHRTQKTQSTPMTEGLQKPPERTGKKKCFWITGPKRCCFFGNLSRFFASPHWFGLGWFLVSFEDFASCCLFVQVSVGICIRWIRPRWMFLEANTAWKYDMFIFVLVYLMQGHAPRLLIYCRKLLNIFCDVHIGVVPSCTFPCGSCAKSKFFPFPEV